MDERLRNQLREAFGAQPDGRKPSLRSAKFVGDAHLADSGGRLFRRSVALAKAELRGVKLDLEALETACFAIQLPFRAGATMPQTSMGVVSIAERCSHAAELLVAFADALPEALIDRTTRILIECPRRQTTLNEAKAVSDPLNLDDFGLSGFCRSAALLVHSGGGLTRLADAITKREQYGYWDARLKDSFHFNSVRVVAARRLAAARAAFQQLQIELQEDDP